jgi:hypothetical protein
MCRVFKLEVVESPETLEALLKQEKNVRRRERLQFLYWYQTGQAKTRQALGKLLNRSQFAIGQWIDIYRHRGLNGLLQLNYRGGNLAPSIPVEIQCQAMIIVWAITSCDVVVYPPHYMLYVPTLKPWRKLPAENGLAILPHP